MLSEELNKSFRIAIAGLGTVGESVVGLLNRHADIIAKKAGRRVELVAVSARNRDKPRTFDGTELPADVAWYDNALDLASLDEIDAIVELIGGTSGTALELSLAALDNKCHLVSANKALLAEQNDTLWERARAHHRIITYEAAVAGGVPIVEALRDSLAANHVTKVYGIINGTCNLILSRMYEYPQPLEQLVRKAQEQGFAEASPEADINGFDSAHKIALMARIVFGKTVLFEKIHIEGITAITADDIRYTKKIGYTIKLIGTAERQQQDDNIAISVMPTLVPTQHLLASVSGVANCVCVHAYPVGVLHFIGSGAGGGPTASAVVADIIRLARQHGTAHTNPLHSASESLAEVEPVGNLRSKFYIRLRVPGGHGVLTGVAKVLADHAISVASMIQYDNHSPLVDLVFISHPTSYQQIHCAIGDLRSLASPSKPSQPLVAEAHSFKILES